MESSPEPETRQPDAAQDGIIPVSHTVASVSNSAVTTSWAREDFGEDRVRETKRLNKRPHTGSVASTRANGASGGHTQRNQATSTANEGKTDQHDQEDVVEDDCTS